MGMKLRKPRPWLGRSGVGGRRKPSQANELLKTETIAEIGRRSQ